MQEYTYKSETDAKNARRALINKGIGVSLISGDTRYEPTRYTFDANTTPQHPEFPTMCDDTECCREGVTA